MVCVCCHGGHEVTDDKQVCGSGGCKWRNLSTDIVDSSTLAGRTSTTGGKGATGVTSTSKGGTSGAGTVSSSTGGAATAG
ncbi:hypothetical protein Taro_051411 [Colocasia esculenta]|uniref:Uncharacterized protein n=1 Tax=Colocasia esculenta TaxID=4460 RepID=A0A843XGS7_COLES|nr:hypothetical protein [Colocasia esculenta]